MLLAALSGLLLTGAFPKIGLDWLAWFALVPLLVAITNLSVKQSFRIGFITGLVHYLSLLYWVVPVMRTYGYLPLYLSVVILFLFAAALAFFPAVFSMALAVFKYLLFCLIRHRVFKKTHKKMWICKQREQVANLFAVGFLPKSALSQNG